MKIEKMIKILFFMRTTSIRLCKLGILHFPIKETNKKASQTTSDLRFSFLKFQKSNKMAHKLPNSCILAPSISQDHQIGWKIQNNIIFFLC
jgi:hypothetical protein